MRRIERGGKDREKLGRIENGWEELRRVREGLERIERGLEEREGWEG